jgi:hypothetical protein
MSSPLAAPRTTRLATRNGRLVRLVELVALSGIVIAQPTYDLLQKNASLFIGWRTTGFQLIAFAAIVALVPPTVLWSVELLAELVYAPGAAMLHIVFVSVLLVELAVEIVKKSTSLTALPIVALAVPLGFAGVILFTRVAAIRMWIRYLAIAPLVFSLIFVGFSPATRVTFDSHAGAANVTVGAPNRVIMIVFDEFPLTSLLDGHGHVDATLFPTFGALAETSTWYRNDTTVAPFTETAVPAILTGRYPKSEHTIPYVSEYPQNLFTLLGRTHQLNVHESVTRLCGTNLCPAKGRRVGERHGIGGMLQDATTLWKGFATPTRAAPFSLNPLGGVDLSSLDTAGEFLSSLHPANGPRLDFLHVLIPHFPWHYLRDGKDYAWELGHTLALVDQKWPTDATGASARERHLLQAQAADSFLGIAIARLKQLGAWDNSLVVVTADHGASFAGGQPFRGVSSENYPNILWTPLFIKAPNQQAGRVDDRPARSIDIVPTIADHLQIRLPWPVDGRSLLLRPIEEAPRRLLDWRRNALRPPPGQKFLAFDGPTGFTQVLKGRATDATGDPALRLYRFGPYGGLVATRAARWTGPSAGIEGTIGSIERYRDVDLTAAHIPWVDVYGTVKLPPNRTVAIVVNGVVAGVSDTYGSPGDAQTQFWDVLPPQLFRTGRNDLSLFAVDGSPVAPVLHEIALTSHP